MTVKDQVGQSVERITGWKMSLPAIVIFDLLGRQKDETDPTARYLLGEVHEAEDEANLALSPDTREKYDPEKEAIELVDCLVFLVSHGIAHGIFVDVPKLMAESVSLNGFGRSDQVYERLKSRVLAMTEGDRIENIHGIFALIVSRLRTLPGVNILEITRMTLLKNVRNRNEEYYANQLYGQPLSWEELVQRYYHSERLLRMLRSEFGSPLHTWAHLPLRHHILNFREPAASEQAAREGMRIMQMVLADFALRPIPVRQYLSGHRVDDILAPNEAVVELLHILIRTNAIDEQTGRLQNGALDYGLRTAGAIGIKP